jgi:hypothetical protein
MKTSIYLQQEASAPCNSLQQRQSGAETLLESCAVGKGINPLVETTVVYL